MNTPTPRTDAEMAKIKIDCDDSCCAVYIEKDGDTVDVVDAEFARGLEREVNRLNAELAGLQSPYSKWTQGDSPHPLMDCAWCGQFMGHGHDCRKVEINAEKK